MKKTQKKQVKASADSIHSSLREKMIEHKFLSNLLTFFWAKKIYDIEIAKSEVDNAGYDLVITINNKTRYIQLKSSSSEKNKHPFDINTRLWSKSNSYVIWIALEEQIGDIYFSYLYARINDINMKSLTAAINSRTKKIRPNIKALPKKNFKEISFPKLMQRLFGIK